MKEKYAAIILAAGKGTRMNEGKNSPIPKVMFEIEGRPIIDYSLENLAKVGFEKPIVIIGFQGEKVKNFLGKRAIYAWQKKRLGTAHAVSCAQRLIGKNIKTILVMMGDDSAFYNPKTLKSIVESHLKNNADMTLLTVKIDNPTGLGRIVKDKTGQVKEIVEEKLATPEIKKIKEINTGCYVFDKDFLLNALEKVKKNPTGEYFLTDLVSIANIVGKKVISFTTDALEWHGVNTPEQLESARIRMRKLKKLDR